MKPNYILVLDRSIRRLALWCWDANLTLEAKQIICITIVKHMTVTIFLTTFITLWTLFHWNKNGIRDACSVVDITYCDTMAAPVCVSILIAGIFSKALSQRSRAPENLSTTDLELLTKTGLQFVKEGESFCWYFLIFSRAAWSRIQCFLVCTPCNISRKCNIWQNV